MTPTERADAIMAGYRAGFRGWRPDLPLPTDLLCDHAVAQRDPVEALRRAELWASMVGAALRESDVERSAWHRCGMSLAWFRRRRIDVARSLAYKFAAMARDAWLDSIKSAEGDMYVIARYDDDGSVWFQSGHNDEYRTEGRWTQNIDHATKHVKRKGAVRSLLRMTGWSNGPYDYEYEMTRLRRFGVVGVVAREGGYYDRDCKRAKWWRVTDGAP